MPLARCRRPAFPEFTGFLKTQIDLQIEGHAHLIQFVGHSAARETKYLAELQHGCVFAQHVAEDLTGFPVASVLDDAALHKDSEVGHVVPDNNGEFGPIVVRIGLNADHAGILCGPGDARLGQN